MMRLLPKEACIALLATMSADSDSAGAAAAAAAATNEAAKAAAWQCDGREQLPGSGISD